MLNNNKSKLLLILSFICILGLSFFFIPFVQASIIAFVEKLKDDDITDVFWKQQMIAFGALGIIFLVILNAIVYVSEARDIFFEHLNKICKVFETIKNNRKYLLLLILFYFIGYFSIIRANFWNNAIDDLPRQIIGCRDWVNFYRYVSELGSIAVHTSMKVFDIAPLTQFIAIFFISLASFFLISIFTNNNFTLLNCISVLPVGLSPFFLANFSYRYDSPYMAFSLLVCVIPFLFKEENKHFIISSVISLFFMCISYQASSGIYIVLAVLVFLEKLFIKKEDAKELTIFTLSSILCFTLTLFIFSLLFCKTPENDVYVDTAIKVSNVFINGANYVKTICSDIGKNCISIFALLTIALFILSCLIRTNINKGITLAVSIIAVAFCFPMTFGAYLALARPEFDPRAYMGIGAFFGAISLICSNTTHTKKHLLYIRNVIIVYFSYTLLAFSFAFGNAQYEQKEYIRFRGTILSYDLSEVIPNTSGEVELLFTNTIDYARSVDLLASIYPVVYKAIDCGFSSHRASEFVLESFNYCKLKSGKNHYYLEEDFQVLKENGYEKIQGHGNKYIITFKTPNLRVIKTRSFQLYNKDE